LILARRRLDEAAGPRSLMYPPQAKARSNPSMCESIILHHKIVQVIQDQAKYLFRSS
jgi:hypothetical protein